MNKTLMLLIFFLLNINYLTVAKEVNISIQNISEIENNVAFELKLDIEKNWQLYSNKKSRFGSQLNIKILDGNKELNTNILFPKYFQDTKYIDNKEFISYVYKDTATIPISFSFPNKTNNIVLIIDYSICNNTCIYRSEKISLGDKFKYKNNIKQDLIYILIFTICGFILNFMPCVLPILAIKLTKFLKYDQHNIKKIKKDIFYFICGIVSFFLILSISTVILKYLGNDIWWGSHFQNPNFIMIIIIILLIMASNLGGEFEIILPQKINTLFLNKNISSITNGFMIGVLSTSCTAPFLGVALSYSITRDYFMIPIFYFFMGIGMAIPYFILMCTPKILTLLPKPGRWMLILKKSFAIILIINALWLLNVLYNQVEPLTILIFILLILIVKGILISVYRIGYSYIAIILLVIFSLLATKISIDLYYEKKDINHIVIEDLDVDMLQGEIDKDNLIFLEITADWCITCKFNQMMVINKEETRKFFKDKKIKHIVLNYTKNNDKIQKFILQNNRYGVPVYIMYGPKNKNGMILNELLTIEEIKNSVIKLGCFDEKNCCVPNRSD
ncbi:MAG: suppressor for copper-sensitivity B [Candidatus Midichloriaceae bacterium]|jgi:suppressor for copper-sensitivity B